MKVKRIYAADTRSGMQKIKKEFGLEAMILANKKTAEGVEIIVALDFDEMFIEKLSITEHKKSVVPAVIEKQLEAKKIVHLKQHQEKKQTRREAVIVKRLKENFTLISKQKMLIKKQQLMLKKAFGNQHHRPVLKNVREELKQLKNIILRQFEYIGWNKWMQQAPEQLELLRRLTQIGLSTKFSRQIVDKIDASLSGDLAWRTALGLWARELSVTHDDILTQGGIVTLVGPTGVGKTTSAAKLAALYAARHGAHTVSLISCDNYRVGAYDQLMAYSRMLGITVLVASNQAELRDMLRGLKNKKLILIDTAGMSKCDKNFESRLFTLDSSLKSVRHYLVISANTQETCLQDTVQTYKRVPLTGCILTKLDEASSLGDALTVAALNKLPFAYLTNGQSVPNDIQAAHIHRLISKAVALAMIRNDKPDDQQMALQYSGMVANI